MTNERDAAFISPFRVEGHGLWPVFFVHVRPLYADHERRPTLVLDTVDSDIASCRSSYGGDDRVFAERFAEALFGVSELREDVHPIRRLVHVTRPDSRRLRPELRRKKRVVQESVSTTLESASDPNDGSRDVTKKIINAAY